MRIIAHELGLIEVVAHMRTDHIRAGIEAIRAGIVKGINREERIIRSMAIEYLEEALYNEGVHPSTLFLADA